MAVGSSATAPPRRYVAYTAAFSCKHTLQQMFEFLTGHLKISREDMRLWKVKDEVRPVQSCMLTSSVLYKFDSCGRVLSMLT